jgi:hypothetical protein
VKGHKHHPRRLSVFRPDRRQRTAIQPYTVTIHNVLTHEQQHAYGSAWLARSDEKNVPRLIEMCVDPLVIVGNNLIIQAGIATSFDLLLSYSTNRLMPKKHL